MAARAKMTRGTGSSPTRDSAGANRPASAEVFERAKKILVGGVDSPVRAFRAVGGTPLMIDRAEGARLYDVDGREYIDYVCSWGALILGHAHPDVVAAVADQARRGTSYGMTSPLEIELAERISQALPSIERLRFVSSGTEATMSAIRLARAFTKRDLILKFEGCYHGHSDSFLVEAGSGLATLGISSSPGVPEALAKLTLNAAYNDADGIAEIFQKNPGKIAAVIVEPVAANMGVAPPTFGFLESLRELTAQDGALLIFDEVITGFRIAFGGAQVRFHVQPDLTTLGKIIGGGLPVAAYGGRRDIMEMVAPLGPVYQAGTLSGNPLAMRAGLATLPKLEAPGFYDDLSRKSGRLGEGLRRALEESGIPGQVNVAGSLMTLFFLDEPVLDYADAKKSNTARYAAFFNEMLDRGVFLAPSQFEALFISAAHTYEDIDRTIEAARESLEALRAAQPAG
ncbi:MAG TPA: glutamate-1-semialdehyde 2,1-aminomutase [Candidatus Sulfotelmatobacter sp.]|nr:glutamate-1-semialdehyde 2,1-aminomutase [Candidatus Sulfotelmatobacter sp.]